jgi:hypothetical protein
MYLNESEYPNLLCIIYLKTCELYTYGYPQMCCKGYFTNFFSNFRAMLSSVMAISRYSGVSPYHHRTTYFSSQNWKKQDTPNRRQMCTKLHGFIFLQALTS